MESIWADYESVEPYIIPETGDERAIDIKVEYGSSAGSSRPYQVCLRIFVSIGDWLNM